MGNSEELFEEITQSLTLKNLIGKGYLPYELIPAITTIDFAKKAEQLSSYIQSFKGEQSSKYCSYSIPKVKHVRRTLGIPNPYHQLKLSKLIVDNWGDINNFIQTSPISLSKPKVNGFSLANDKREIRTFSRKINLSEISKYSILNSTDSRYLLKSDISRFYPTIYTHIIPWALHSKELSKASLNDKTLFKSLYGNDIDTFVRATQENQTIGIPIGPDTSLVISEIIGGAIDKRLEKELKEKKIRLKGFRFVDDFYLYFKTYNEAQIALSTLHQIAKDLELELSPEKTQIIELPFVVEPKWTLELRDMQKKFETNDFSDDEILTYFSRAFELSKEYANESVLKYAVSEIADLQVKVSSWEIYESLLYNAMVVEPSILSTATEILLGYKMAKYPIDEKKLKETLFEIILYHIPSGHTHEISWALWICKTFKFKVPVKLVKELVKLDDCIISLMLLDLRSMNKISNLDVSKWNGLLMKENLYTTHWLLVYESMLKGWLSPEDGQNFLLEDRFFKYLFEKNISFYDENNQVVPVKVKVSKAEMQARRNVRRKRRFY
ncbi:RNA-directed DNA polymerase [Paenibacillus polymyxa]|uniref:RNA-directed DNA polymerase n=1 Tax=Paenibacillus polymyxa TaxID=1406 RepID=UPI000F4FF829|nr:RNA-directed DNA polymerase [Paenibacillus polymyxa]RPE03285.1 RNA-directed DNA polymerase [Paenibacillus polymyxa]